MMKKLLLQITRKRTIFAFTYWNDDLRKQVFTIAQKELVRDNFINWLSELRCKENKQTNYTLVVFKNNTAVAYCCLGILGKSLDNFEEKYCSKSYLTTSDFRDLLNIPSLSNASIFQTFFTKLNDEYVLTFEEIANVIEQIIEFCESDKPYFEFWA